MANGKAFTEEDLKLVNDTSLTHTEVAKLTGRLASTICIKRKALGVKAKNHLDQYRKHVDLLTDLTKTNGEIAKILNLPSKTIAMRRWYLGIKGIY
jgi:hypothetical protein